MELIYTDAIFRYGNEVAFWNRMAAIGHPAQKDDDGNLLKVEKRAFLVMGWPTTDSSGDIWQRARMTADDADKMPPENNPAFAIVWRSDDLVDGELKPEPVIEVDIFDVDSNPDGTRLQGVGTF